MPFIIAKTNRAVSENQAERIKTALGRAIPLVPGKSEDYLLVEVRDKCRLFLRGKPDEPIAYITASIFGNESHAGLSGMKNSELWQFCDRPRQRKRRAAPRDDRKRMVLAGNFSKVHAYVSVKYRLLMSRIYPNATSSTIMSANPVAKPSVQMSVFSSRVASGSSSSTTT